MRFHLENTREAVLSQFPWTPLQRIFPKTFPGWGLGQSSPKSVLLSPPHWKSTRSETRIVGLNHIFPQNLSGGFNLLTPEVIKLLGQKFRCVFIKTVTETNFNINYKVNVRLIQFIFWRNQMLTIGGESWKLALAGVGGGYERYVKWFIRRAIQ